LRADPLAGCVQGYEPGNVIDPGTAAHREHGHAGAYLFDWLRWACAFIGLAVLSGKLFIWQVMGVW